MHNATGSSTTGSISMIGEDHDANAEILKLLAFFKNRNQKPVPVAETHRNYQRSLIAEGFPPPRHFVRKLRGPINVRSAPRGPTLAEEPEAAIHGAGFHC